MLRRLLLHTATGTEGITLRSIHPQGESPSHNGPRSTHLCVRPTKIPGNGCLLLSIYTCSRCSVSSSCNWYLPTLAYLANFVTLGLKEVNGVNQRAYPSVSCSAVLFDAPQIPAGMHPFRRIPQESTGFQWNGTGIQQNEPGFQWNGTGIQQNEPGFHWIVTEGTCISACKYKCVYINRLL